MAVINIDDVYILDETGAEVDKVTGLFTKNENATTGEKQMARLNIAAGGSNRNLLDNAYFVGGGSQLGDGIFPINQRGQTSYSGSGNIFDRWTLQNAFANLVADAVYFGSTTQNVWGLMQQVPSCFRNLWGKTVTVSAILNNDELVQATYTIPSSGAFDMPAAGSGGVFVNLYSFDGSNIVFRIYTQYTASYHIKAVKLELGTVSTLANDAQPNYWLELQKCKARLRFVPLTRCPIVFASGNAYLDLNGCEMEGAPIAALYSNDGGVIGSSGTSAAITSVTNIAIQHNVPLLQFNLTGTINDQVGQIFNTVVQLSSEL